MPTGVGISGRPRTRGKVEALNALYAVEQVYLRDQLDQQDTTVTRESE
jgi:hypothetical protein